MIESKQTSDKQYPNADRITTGQPYTGSVITSTGGRVDRVEDANQLMTQGATGSAGSNTHAEVSKAVDSPTRTLQPETSAENRGINPALSRALIGGLIGATLGSLAAAFAGKKTSEGVNHAAKGIGKALNTVGQGLNQTAKGVGEAAISIAEGTRYAVVGGALEAATGVAEGTKQVVVGTADAVQDTAQSVGQTVQSVVKNTADAVQDTAQSVSQTAQGTADAIKNTVEDLQPDQTQSNVYQRTVVANPQSVADEIGMSKETDMSPINTAPKQKELIVAEKQITPVTPEMSVAPDQDILIDGETYQTDNFR